MLNGILLNKVLILLKAAALEDVITVQADRVKNLKRAWLKSVAIFIRNMKLLTKKRLKKHLRPVAKDALLLVQSKLSALTQWNTESIHNAINQNC